MSKKVLKNVRINPITGEADYFFPMEVTDDSVLIYAHENSLEVGWARLGYRKYKAVFVPCKEQVEGPNGKVAFLPTSSYSQRTRYLSLIKDEMRDQEDTKQDGRCQIPNGHGSLKRCPLRVSNPDYTPGGVQPKTIPVNCEGCIYEPFRQAHTTITVSCLDHENEEGEIESYEVPSPPSYYAGDRYLELKDRFIAFVKEKDLKLAPLAQLLVDEYTKSESSRELEKATSTIGSQTKKLQELLTEFLDNTLTF